MAVMTESPGGQRVRPFTIDIPEADLEDLRARIAATRWPEKEGVEDASQGVQLATMQAVARYWETEYDWRKCEAKLNSVPNFITEIDGLDIHFVHVRSKHEDALPLIVCHGWPGSVIEQMKIIDLLTDPTAHGGSASDAFHVVIPNMPGYGFSGKPTETGWDPIHIGRAWVTLMKRLGYERFVAAGGDYGALVIEYMAGGRDAPASPSRRRRSCWDTTPTSPACFRPTSTRRSRPAARCRPISQPTSNARSSSSGPSTSTRRTPCSWGRARRRCTGSTTPRSAWRRSCSTTTRRATS